MFDGSHPKRSASWRCESGSHAAKPSTRACVSVSPWAFAERS